MKKKSSTEKKERLSIRLKKNLKVRREHIKEEAALIGHAATRGNVKTRFSFLIMGFGSAFQGQIIKGILFLFAQVAYVLFLINFGLQYISQLPTLGSLAQGQVFDEGMGIYVNVQGDNSMLILLFSVLTIFISIGFIMIYFMNIKSAYKAQLTKESGKKPSVFKQDIIDLVNGKFHVTLLILPIMGALIFTVLPLIFMVLIAFTNFDKTHQPPGNLFTWVGFENFKDIFWQSPIKSHTFMSLFVWTMIWAVFATFSNYILGMILAVMINKKGIKLKKMWRTIFVITIAVPQFVSLMLMSKLLADMGPLNVLLNNAGLISQPIHFLTDGDIARITVILVNMWVGIPYTMLITTGILMNIPEDMYEAARIDGAGPFKIFMKITLPYMLFITSPYLITQFIGNINNFNVIFLLTGGGPFSLDYYQAGETDLLVTWLYKLTVNQQDYNLASAIGIFIFIISSVVALVTYNMTSSTRKEDQFQ